MGDTLHEISNPALFLGKYLKISTADMFTWHVNCLGLISKFLTSMQVCARTRS